MRRTFDEQDNVHPRNSYSTWPFRVLTVAKKFDRLQLHVEPTATTLIRDRRAEVLLGCK